MGRASCFSPWKERVAPASRGAALIVRAPRPDWLDWSNLAVVLVFREPSAPKRRCLARGETVAADFCDVSVGKEDVGYRLAAACRVAVPDTAVRVAEMRDGLMAHIKAVGEDDEAVGLRDAPPGVRPDEVAVSSGPSPTEEV